MSERTVTIPLEEYNELTSKDKVFRYYTNNGRKYTWYNKVPKIEEIENRFKEDYEVELNRWKDAYAEYHSKFNRTWDKLDKIPNWIRRLYGAE